MPEITVTSAGKKGCYAVEGALTATRIDKNTFLALDFSRFDQTRGIVLDLESVQDIDSAGLALLVEWLKMASTTCTPLQFANIPEHLLAIARLSNLEQLITDNQVEA